MTTQHLPPFTCSVSPGMQELLWKLQGTLAITTYQAGKLIFISSVSERDIIQLPRQYDKAMGLAVKDNRLAVATQYEVQVLASSGSLARNYGSGSYDTLYLPRATYYSGEIDLHDMAWGNEGLWGVNTRFSCLSIIDDEFSFKARWQPSFITGLTPDDRCHLNGMAMENGKPRYVTALGSTDSPKGWRASVQNGGILMDVESGEIITHGLAMPHSPRICDNRLFVLCSATGELISIDTHTGRYDVVTRLNGFLRGMCRKDDILFIGLSGLRKNSGTFRNLPVAKNPLFCGIVAVHLSSGEPVGYIRYENSVEEIYDVQFLEGLRRPGILNTQKEDHRKALVTEKGTFWSES